MKSNRIILIAAAGLSIAMLGSCNIYKKYELPTEDSAVAKAYREAREQGGDSAAFGNLASRTVVTAPTLHDL